MKSYGYYKVIRNTTLQILDLFNDITVKRYSKDGSIEKIIGKVPIRFGPKDKLWNWVKQKDWDVVLPRLSLFFKGISLDPNRLKGLHTKVIGTPDYGEGTYSAVEKVTPYSFDYQLTVWCKFYEDLNQILENLLPWFSPFVPITIKSPGEDKLLNFKVSLTGASNNTSDHYSTNDRRLIVWDLSFKVQALLFGAIDPDDNKLIKKAYTHWWGKDSTASYSNIDGTSYYQVQLSGKENRNYEDVALGVTTGIDYTAGVLDWEYAIYEPGSKYND